MFSNCGFLGYPVLRALYGGEAVFVASMYVLIFQILSFTYGVRQISAGSPSSREFDIKQFCTPMVITSLLAQGTAPLSAAALGVLLHARAGDAIAEAQSARSIMASDLIQGLCHVFE